MWSWIVFFKWVVFLNKFSGKFSLILSLLWLLDCQIFHGVNCLVCYGHCLIYVLNEKIFLLKMFFFFKFINGNLIPVLILFLWQQGMVCEGFRGRCWKGGCNKAPYWGSISPPRCTVTLVIQLKTVTEYEGLKYTCSLEAYSLFWRRD